MALVTLGQAAKLCSVSKTQLVRDIKRGKLSATRNEDGTYAIDTSELARVRTVTPVTVSAGVTAVQKDTPQVTQDADVLVRLAVAEEKIKSLQDMLQDARTQRDEWQSVAKQNQQLLLTYKSDNRGFLKRLFG
jgi:hypothetical protein